jgi:CheY-like chemotaxis protein
MVHPSGRSVLVVEDDFSSLEVLVMLMREEGLQVITASDGEEALERLATEPGVALVVTDYMMPKLNGIELCRKMRADERFRSIPVILMSATFFEPLEDAPQIVAVFGKPLLFDSLLAKMREVLERPASFTPST